MFLGKTQIQSFSQFDFYVMYWGFIDFIDKQAGADLCQGQAKFD